MRNCCDHPFSPSGRSALMAGGAVGMSAHSNHTSPPLSLTTQGCSLFLLAKWDAGGFGNCWKNPGRSVFAKGGALGSRSFYIHSPKAFGPIITARRPSRTADGPIASYSFAACGIQPRWAKEMPAVLTYPRGAVAPVVLSDGK
jgi:hypothetical protein